jgi:hypothetical protein
MDGQRNIITHTGRKTDRYQKKRIYGQTNRQVHKHADELTDCRQADRQTDNTRIEGWMSRQTDIKALTHIHTHTHLSLSIYIYIKTGYAGHFKVHIKVELTNEPWNSDAGLGDALYPELVAVDQGFAVIRIDRAILD